MFLRILKNASLNSFTDFISHLPYNKAVRLPPPLSQKRYATCLPYDLPLYEKGGVSAYLVSPVVFSANRYIFFRNFSCISHLLVCNICTCSMLHIENGSSLGGKMKKFILRASQAIKGQMYKHMDGWSICVRAGVYYVQQTMAIVTTASVLAHISTAKCTMMQNSYFLSNNRIL